MEKISFKISKSKFWMVVYTRPRWEKKVDSLLKEAGIESYCPVRKLERQWADRKKMVEMPLFNSYIFVKINPSEEFRVKQTLGVLSFIYFMGKPAIVRDHVIEDIKHFMDVCPDMETINLQDISRGDRVQIKSGVFFNQQGEVIQVQGKNILMVLEQLGCAIITKVPINNIALIQ